jgi:serine/threonine-protein kinase
LIFLLGEERSSRLPTFVSVSIYFVVSVVLWRRLRRPEVPRRVGWAIPLVDAPVVSVGLVLQTSTVDAALGLMNATAIMLTLMVLSLASLSRPAILTTALVVLTPVVYRLHALDLLLATPALLVGWGVTTFVLLFVVVRLRHLVQQARADRLLGKYVLGRRLGSGGMAEVFEATMLSEGVERRVAVKKILPTHVTRPESIELLRREAQVGLWLRHPGVVQVLDSGHHGGTWFIAMEFVDGVSLKDVLADGATRGRALPLVAIVHLARQLAEALDYVHTRTDSRGAPMGLVHRDLNPPNILLARDGQVKLSDFGIALSLTQERLTETGVVRGKAGYTAPEQLKGLSTDARVDLFALGVTLWECVVGKRLFSATSDVALLRQCLEQPLEPPSARRAGVPPVLDALIMRLLAREVEQRTPSAMEVLRELTRLPPELLDPQAGRAALASLVSTVRVEPRRGTETSTASLEPASVVTKTSDFAA